MGKIYEHMMNCRLHTRMMIYFSTMVIASVLLVAGISYIASYRIVEELAESFSKQSAESVADNLNDIFSEAENLAALVENNSIFQKVLSEPLPGDIRERYSTELEYDFELYRLTGYTVNQFGGLYVLGNNGYNFKSHNVTFQNRDFRKETWYQEVLNADGFLWLAPQTYSRVSQSIDKRYAGLGYPVINRANGARMGIVLVEIEADTIESILKEFGNVDHGIIQILDGDDCILFKREGETDGIGKSDTNGNKSRSVFYYNRDMENGWSVESFIPKRILLKGIINLGLLLGGVITVLIFIAVKVTSIISKSVTNPIQRLIELMEQAEREQFDVSMNVKYRDELAILGNKFNDMMAFTRHLIEINDREHEKLREAELKTLQMQINPHFLYNTLETVVWLIRCGDGNRAIGVLMSLSRFFRIGLSRGRSVISLREELEHVKEYMNIQNTRYKDRIAFQMEVEDETLLELQIPKLVLQPLVENAIYHGIQEKSGDGHIKVGIHRFGRLVRIFVEDDGIGMTYAQLTRLRQGLDGDGNVGFGVYNTNQRLRKMFGEVSGIKVQSQFGEGTMVEFLIPF